MPSAARILGQGAFYIAIAIAVGWFSSRPMYSQMSPEWAQIKVSFTHGGARLVDCRRLTPEEIAKLPANERRANTCSGERLPVFVALSIDGRRLFEGVLPPTGLGSDGPSHLYQKFAVPVGGHVLKAQMRDSRRTEGFDYEQSFAITLKPLQNLAVDFRPDEGGFVIR